MLSFFLEYHEGRRNASHLFELVRLGGAVAKTTLFICWVTSPATLQLGSVEQNRLQIK